MLCRGQISALGLQLRGKSERRKISIGLADKFGLGRMAEERRRQPIRDGDQIALDEVDELVQSPGDNLLDRAGAEDRTQLVEAFGDIVATAQRIARFEL